MKKYTAVIGLLILLAGSAIAAPNVAQAKVPLFPKTLINARYVYVAAYDGDQFNANLWPEDRAAIENVQDALRQWGRYTIVYSPEDADMILLVQSRSSEDVLAAYDAHTHSSAYLWRVMGRAGLQKGETPLMSQLQQAVDTASK